MLLRIVMTIMFNQHIYIGAKFTFESFLMERCIDRSV